mmetsp:Transcript_51394/g.109346  ORF Transcript_51394/g.109346 Transcript_51394/m.109346 type:complete len:102 (+) Transcript_51394:442-747(+)
MPAPARASTTPPPSPERGHFWKRRCMAAQFLHEKVFLSTTKIDMIDTLIQTVTVIGKEKITIYYSMVVKGLRAYNYKFQVNSMLPDVHARRSKRKSLFSGS